MTQQGKNTAGLLPISAVTTQKSGGSGPPVKKAPKPPVPRLKLLIRRLPPGLTQAELENALGTRWKVGAGKVDWLQFKPGKLSKDPAKPSRPSRAYIHVVSNDCVAALSDTVRQGCFQDARNTFHDPILLGPPSLEFAPYAKTPGSRPRKDARQGTIDQDVDFIAFLESLTQPVARPAGVDAPTDVEEKKKKETVMITPLVQFIKDKKASKSRDGSGSKSKNSRAVKESKQEKMQAKKLLQRNDKDSTTSSDKGVKGEKPPSSKESAKTAKTSTSANTKAAKPKAPSNAIKESSVAPERKRERGNAAVATKILQRDLGLSTANGRRRGKGAMGDAAPSKDVTSGELAVPSAVALKKDPKPVKSTPAASLTTRAKDGEPSSLTDTASVPVTPPAKTSKGGKSKVSSTAKQAFLKHANPSQGVTEALLEASFSPFGAVTRVEIDKKKGFGYVDFAGPDGLRKAIAASPVSVAQSQVVVLERKENPGSDKSGKGRDAASASKVKGAAEAPVGAGTGTGGATGTGSTPRSSRGSRGGRGSRSKGHKGAAASEKAAEAKSEPA